MPTTTYRRVGRSKLATSTRAYAFLQAYYRPTRTSYLTEIRNARAQGLSIRDAIATLVVEARHINRQLRKMTRLA